MVALQDQAQNDLPGLAGVLNNWFHIENNDLVRHEEFEIALQQENVQPAFEDTMETDPSPSTSSSTEIAPPEDSSDAEDDEVLTLTRMEALNSVTITEGTEMVR